MCQHKTLDYKKGSSLKLYICSLYLPQTLGNWAGLCKYFLIFSFKYMIAKNKNKNGLSINFPPDRLFLNKKLTRKPRIMSHKSTKDLEERCLEIKVLLWHLWGKLLSFLVIRKADVCESPTLICLMCIWYLGSVGNSKNKSEQIINV